MSTKLFPERQRCSSCRKKLDDVVVDGIFCSYSCASVSPPSTNVRNAPRECKREIGGKWDFKKRYRSESEVPPKLRADPGTNIYRCSYCRHLHVGHSRPDPFTREKMVRLAGDPSTVGSVISRMRQERGWTVQRLAAYLKVPQVKIVEVESGKPGARLDVAMAALRALGVSMVLQEK